MKDTFDEVMSKILIPMDELGSTILDTTYFLKDTGSFVYTEGYWHPEGRVIGKIINYPCERGAIDIYGRRYESVTKRRDGGGLVLVPHNEQMETHYRIDPGLKPPGERLLLTEHHHPFDLSSMRGWFCNKKSMLYAMERYPRVAENVRGVSALLGVPLDRMGVTGSLAYGHMDDGEDIDLSFFGTPEQNMEIARKIWHLTYTDPKSRCVEFGKFWPLRFVYNGMIICNFFVYSDRKQVPVFDQRVELLKEPVQAFGTVADNLHSIYMPLVIKLKDVYIDSKRSDDIDLIVYDGSIRGEFYNNERLHVAGGRLVRLIGEKSSAQAIAVVDAGDIEKERFVKGVPAF